MKHEQPFDRLNKHTSMILLVSSSLYFEESVKKVFFTLSIQFHKMKFQRLENFHRNLSHLLTGFTNGNFRLFFYLARLFS